MASLPQIFLKSSLLTSQEQLGYQKQYLQSSISVMQLNLSTTLARNFFMYCFGKFLDDGMISLVLERKYCIYVQNDWASFHLFLRTSRFRKSNCFMSNFTDTLVIRDMSKLSIIYAYVNNFKFYSYFLALAYGFFFDFLSYGLSFFYYSIGLDVSSYYAQLEALFRPIWAKKHFTASTSYFPVRKKHTADEGSLLASFFPFIALINGRWTNLGGVAPKMVQRQTCLFVFVSHSYPLMTWVMPIFQSSITLARWKVGHPFDLTITKSSKGLNQRSPNTQSLNVFGRGMRSDLMRTAYYYLAIILFLIYSKVRLRHLPSYLYAYCYYWSFFSSCLQKQGYAILLFKSCFSIDLQRGSLQL